MREYIHMARILQLFGANSLILVFMKNNGICSLISFLGGALVGSVVTMLVTPQSGPDLRRKISNYVEREADKIRCQCDDDK